MNIVRPSLSLLPMEDIAAELKSEKPNRKFMTRDDKATDVEQVGGIDSDRIAISAEGHDRQTVNNALHLNGKLASEYVTTEDGERFLKISSELSEITGNEIRNLRDELYQLYSELSKKGLISNTVKYEGFVEAFKRNNVLYEDYICGISNAVIGRTKDLYIADVKKMHFFEEGKTFVIKRVDTNQEQVVKSLGINEAGRVTFEPAVNFLDSVDNIGLYKSLGQYINSTFSFSEIKRSVSEQKDRYYSQSDDTDTKYLIINKPNSGFAATFKVPRSIKSEKGIAGALSQFAIRAQAINSPGGIRCHVIDFDAVISKGQVAPKFSNIEDAINKGFVLATSNVVYPSRENTTYENDVYFDFYGGVHQEYKNGTTSLDSRPDGEISFSSHSVEEDAVESFETADHFPILKDAKYCFIVECLGATETSYWRLRFSYYKNNDYVDDLQRRNASYIYNTVDTSGLINDKKCIEIIDDINKFDIMYTLVIKDIVEEEEVGKQEGVYTTRIVLPNPIDVTRARLTLRVNREGMYNIKEHNAEYTIFVLEPNTPTSHTPSDTRFKIGDKIIIGNVMATVKRVSTSEIEIERPAYIDERIIKYYTTTIYDEKVNGYVKKTNIPVYRLSYEPTIKAKLVDWNNFNESDGKYESKDITSNPLEFDLMAVIPDQFKSDIRISDRLLFEASFGKDESNKNNLANEFELQINWKSPFSAREINEIKDSKDNNFKELIGRIHDLNLSLDRNY